MRRTLILIATFVLALQAYSQTEEEAMSMVNDSLKANPNNVNWLYVKGLILSQSKKFEQAIPYLTLSLKNLHQFKIENPNALAFPNELPLDSCDILRERAYCYDLLDSVNNSVNDYRYVQMREPNDLFYSTAVSRLYIKHKIFDKAQIEIDRLKDRKGNNERGLVQQAILFYEQQEYNKAQAAVAIALKKYPASIEGLMTQGKILVKLNRQTESCKYFSEAKSKMTLAYFGGQRGYQRDFEKDIESLKKLYCK